MRRVTRNGVIALAAASGAMAVAGPAYAGAGAEGSAAGSPGLVSGNTVQLPVHVPVNACGNTVNVVGLLNPAAGTTCVNEDAADPGDPAGASSAGPGADADGTAGGSPGVLSGNGVQLPVALPVNVTGNSVNVVGVGNPAVGNTSANTPGERPGRPADPEAEPPAAPPHTLPAPQPAPHTEQTAALAETGTDGALPVAATGAALFLAGVALHRRFRTGPRG
ncbi:chaplin [Streptomyces sp. H28]|uniref:chaplin n=1 Tax=Streptomyces sp. H28 TaxID=2775865 RepID=UPI003EC5659B